MSETSTTNRQLTENFNLSEFQCESGAEMPGGVERSVESLAYALQTIREELGSVVDITSGYRSPEHNKKVGGAKNSQHLKGTAVDFKVRDYTPKQVYLVIERLIKEKKIPQGGLKAYSTWVHYDIRGFKARW